MAPAGCVGPDDDGERKRCSLCFRGTKAALSDQGNHPPYILHGVYYMKDRELGSAVFTIPLLPRHQGSFVTSSQPFSIHIHNAWCLLHKRQGGWVSSVHRTFASAASRRVSMRWASSRMTESTNGGFAWKLPHVGSVRKRHTQQDSDIRSTPTISTHTVWRVLLDALVCKHSGTERGQGRVCIRHIAPLVFTLYRCSVREMG